MEDIFNNTLQQKDKNLPRIYWIPKLHKTPYKARFLVGSSSCTTTKLFSTLYTSLPHARLKTQLHDLLERVFNTRGKRFIATNNFRTFWTNDRNSTKYTYVSCRELCSVPSYRQYLRPHPKLGFSTSCWYTDGH